MVALRIYVLVCASTEQFPNKSAFIKAVSVTATNLQSMFFTVKPVYSGHLWFLKKCPLSPCVRYIEFWVFWAKKYQRN